MTLRQLIVITKAYQDLGWAVQNQLDEILVGNLEEQNAHALKLIATWLTTIERHQGKDATLQEDVDLTREDLEQAFENADA